MPLQMLAPHAVMHAPWHTHSKTIPSKLSEVPQQTVLKGGGGLFVSNAEHLLQLPPIVHGGAPPAPLPPVPEAPPVPVGVLLDVDVVPPVPVGEVVVVEPPVFDVPPAFDVPPWLLPPVLPPPVLPLPPQPGVTPVPKTKPEASPTMSKEVLSLMFPVLSLRRQAVHISAPQACASFRQPPGSAASMHPRQA
jgi:hypothetical protein